MIYVKINTSTMCSPDEQDSIAISKFDYFKLNCGALIWENNILVQNPEFIQNFFTEQVYGVEIEFSCKEIYNLYLALNKAGIKYVISNKAHEADYENIVIKPEISVKHGYEINFPPAYSRISDVLSIISQYVKITKNCALHVHISDPRLHIDILPTFTEKYKQYELTNIALLKEHNLYHIYSSIDLTADELKSIEQESLVTNYNNIESLFDRRRLTLNVFKAFKRHRTVEFRLYKSTLDYTELMFCVNNAIEIVNNCLADINKETE